MKQEYTPNISKVTVSKYRFNITTYRTKEMSVVDSFTINRTPEQHAVKAGAADQYGTVAADKTKAAEGDTVKLTTEPAEGHVLDTLKVTDSKGNEIPVKDGAFKMPDDEVTFTASFKADYKLVEGDGQTITEGVKKPLTFKANGAVDTCTGVVVDGKALDPSTYSLKKGSTVVTIDGGTAASLAAGDHTVDVTYPDGKASGGFTVKAAGKSTDKPSAPSEPGKGTSKTKAGNGTSTSKAGSGPKTGDTSNSALWVVLLLAGAGALTGTLVYRHKRQR